MIRITQGSRNIIVTYGPLVERAIRARDILRSEGIEVGVLLLERLKPYQPIAEFIDTLGASHILFAEEGIKNGGAAMIVGSMLHNVAKYDIAAIDDSFLLPDSPTDIYDFAGISEEKLADYFRGSVDG